MKYISLIVFLTLIAGCEQVVPSDGLPYAEHIVVHGVLVAGQAIDSISITQTLPLTLAYDRQAAAIPTADVRIIVDNRSIQLAYIGDGYFSDTTSTLVESGKQYSLDVRWNGLHATAATLVPEPPTADSAKLGARQIIYNNYGGTYRDSSMLYPLLVRVHTLPDVAFAMRRDSLIEYSDTSISIEDYKDVGGFNDIQLPAKDSLTFWFESGIAYVGNYFPVIDSVKLLATMASFDKAYYDFLRTSNDYRDDSPFANNGKNPIWNIHGDGIGYFIGESRAQVFLSFKP